MQKHRVRTVYDPKILFNGIIDASKFITNSFALPLTAGTVNVRIMTNVSTSFFGNDFTEATKQITLKIPQQIQNV